MPDLKPCPFCGEMPKLVKMFDGRTRTIEIQPNCIPGKCHKRGVVTTTTFEELRELAESEAIAAWNARADDAELTALRARVEQLEAAQRWVPVSERLPEEGQLVVVFTPINVGDNFRYETLVWRSRYAKYVNNHLWMPLPQPPEVTHEAQP